MQPDGERPRIGRTLVYVTVEDGEQDPASVPESRSRLELSKQRARVWAQVAWRCLDDPLRGVCVYIPEHVRRVEHDADTVDGAQRSCRFLEDVPALR